MLPSDVSQLIIRYTIQSNKLPRWIDKSMHGEVIQLHRFGSNPRAAKYIMKNLSKFKIERLVSNPDPRIIKYVRSYVDTYRLDGQTMGIIVNLSKDPDFIKWVENKVNEFMDKQMRKLPAEEFYDLLRIMLQGKLSKNFFDRYLAPDNELSERVFMDRYPYFPNESKEINEQYFITMLKKSKHIPFSVRNLPVPLIIKKLEIIYGLASSDTIPDPIISENLSILLRDKPDDKACISKNPGAIHILKAKPELIDSAAVLVNPNIGELIESGLVQATLPQLIKLRTNDSKVFDIIKRTISEPIRDIDFIENLDVSNPYFFESYGETRLIRRVLSYLVYF